MCTEIEYAMILEMLQKRQKEQKELQENKRPDLYHKKTNNQTLLCFIK